MKQTKRDLVSIKVSREAYLVIDKEQSDAKQNRVKSATQDEIVDRWLAAYQAAVSGGPPKVDVKTTELRQSPDGKALHELLASIYAIHQTSTQATAALGELVETLSKEGQVYEEAPLLNRTRELKRIARELIERIERGKGPSKKTGSD